MKTLITVISLLCLLPVLVNAQEVVFSDDFQGGPDSAWIMPNGGWVAQDGQLFNDTTCAYLGCMAPLYSGADDFTASRYELEFTPTAVDNPSAPVFYFMAHVDQPALWHQGTSGYSITMGYSNRCNILRVDEGSSTLLTQVTASAFNFQVGTTYKLIVETDESEIRVKVFVAGQAEPDWQVTAMDDTYRVGYFGLSTWNTYGLLDNVNVLGIGVISTESMSMDNVKALYR